MDLSSECTCDREGMDEMCPTHGSPEAQLAGLLNEKAEAFDALCAERHEEGASRYGQLTFLENDVLRMMLEELADTANYCRMQAVKLLILQERLERDLTDKLDLSSAKTETIEMGFESFKGTKDVGWKR